MLVALTVPVVVGGAGLVPKAYFSACFLISSRRQVHSALVVILVPSSFVNGSGSLAMVGNDPEAGRAATVQFDPVSSVVAPPEVPPVPVLPPPPLPPPPAPPVPDA